MTRNRIWLWRGYDAAGKLIGELEATDAAHAMTEFQAECPDAQCVRVERIKGSGQPG